MTYTAYFAVKRRCHRCNVSKPTAGGKTYPGGRTWVCRECLHKQFDIQHKKGAA